MQTALRAAKPAPAAGVDGFLRTRGAGTTVVTYRPRARVYSQGDASDSVMYLQEGTVKLSVLSRGGQEAVVAMLEAGAFFGENAVLGDAGRHQTAVAMTAATVLIIPKTRMIRLLHEQHEFANRFIAHLLGRNTRLEEDIVDQLFNSSEKRLARALLLLAHQGPASRTQRVPQISQQTLADMVGTTRSRVNLFMNRFRTLGYIEFKGGLKVNDSLSNVFLPNERLPVHPSKPGEALLRPVRRKPTESTV